MIRLKYLGGHPKLAGPRDYFVTRVAQNIEFRALEGFRQKTLLSIPRALFVDGGDFVQGHTRSTGKAAAGAIAGAVIAGPLGGIAGAALGGRARARNSISIPVLDEQGRQHNMLFNGTEADYTNLLYLIYN